MGKMQTRMVLAVGVAAVAFLVVMVASAAAQTSVSVGSATVDSGETFTINVTLSNTPIAGIGAYGFNISFDPSVVQVKGVTNLQGLGASNWNNDTGWVKLGGAVMPAGADGIYGTIAFEAVGVDGTSTTLDITVEDLTDGDANPITCTVTDGLVTVGEVPPVTSVTVGSKGVEEGGTTAIDVTLSNTPVAGIGAYGFNISFDPSVVQVKGVTNLQGLGASNWNNDTGWVKLGGAVMPAGADGIYGTIAFEAVGIDGTSTTLDITVEDLTDGDANPITCTATDGLVTITGVPTVEVVINEFSSYNATGDWIELYNKGASEVSLKGWSINDSTGEIEAFTAGDSISTDGYFAIDAGNRLNQGGDAITLLKNGEVVDQIAYGTGAGMAPAPAAKNSTGRYPNGVDTGDDAADFIEFDVPTPGAANVIPTGQDLIVTEILVNPACANVENEVFILENNVIGAVILNNGTVDATAFNVSFTAEGNPIGESPVVIDSLAAGSNTTVLNNWTPPADYIGNVTLTVTADSDNVIAESNEANNEKSQEIEICNNGYKGKSFVDVPSLVLQEHDTINGSIVYTVGNSTKVELPPTNATTTGFEVTIPENATVKTARLYVYWYDSWYSDVHANADLTVTFEGLTFTTPDANYTDSKGFGTYDYPKGTYAYDVTSGINETGTYTAAIENAADNTRTVLTGQLLVVVYEDASEPEIEYWLTEGCDLLKADSRYCVSPEEAIAEVTFTGTITDVSNKSGRLITIVAQGNTPGTDLSFNEQIWEDVWQEPEGNSVIDIEERTVTLASSNNVVGFRDTQRYSTDGTDGMQTSNAILVIAAKAEYPWIGDMDGNGEVNFKDVITLAKHIYFDDPIYDDPDVNSDGEVTFGDVILLAKHIYFGDPIYP